MRAPVLAAIPRDAACAAPWDEHEALRNYRSSLNTNFGISHFEADRQQAAGSTWQNSVGNQRITGSDITGLQR
jgi:hypothetical protein